MVDFIKRNKKDIFGWPILGQFFKNKYLILAIRLIVVAALFSAIIAGVLQDLFNADGGEEIKEEVKSCCSSKAKNSECEDKLSFKQKINKGFKYAYVDLFDDISS